MAILVNRFGINTEGLKRREFSKHSISQIRRAYKIVYRQGHTLDEALKLLTEMVEDCAAIQLMIDTIKSSTRGIIR